MFEVELDIFSGRPNPRWTLTSAEEQELLGRIFDRTVPMTAPAETDGYLGYRGFVLRATGSAATALTQRGYPTTFRVRDGVGSGIEVGAERWLLFTGGDLGIPDSAVAEAERGVDTASADAKKKCKPYFTSTTDFSDWNGQWWQGENNCYNYGSNWRTDTFAQPGRGAGEMYHGINVPEILAAAERDGYVQKCKSKKAIHVGFAIWPGVDYHWWRRTEPMDGEVRWCHKPGGTPVRNKDSSGEWITDPSTCNRGGYTQWGYFMFQKGKHNKTVR